MTSLTKRLRVLLVEHEGGTIHSVKAALENDPRLEYSGYIASRSQVERQFSLDAPDVALVDMWLVRSNTGLLIQRSEQSFAEGLATISLITQLSPATRVIGFSDYFIGNANLVKAALQCGAAALIAKQKGPADWEAWSHWLRAQILSVVDGWFELSPEVARLIEAEEYARRTDMPNDPLPLTERQMEVLHLLASGVPDEEIAKRLTIVPGAVRGHISNIKERLHLRHRWEVIEAARRHGIGQAPDGSR
ncbi:MAG: response regulator transcription factor [Caldilineaceae bacterium]